MHWPCGEIDGRWNLSKCVVLRLTLKLVPIISSYKVNSHLLESVSTCKDLGVTLDTKLLFASHVNSIISESRRTLGMIKRFGKGLPMEALIIVYTTFVRTKLEYAYWESEYWQNWGKYFDLLFLFKSVNAYYDCQPFFGLHVPGRSRTFHEPGGRINFELVKECAV
jgi:hypothetical protein